ncbi:hypothetical protein PQX77_013849 [Marasmius sp. AFHP31]|nr:hypothetical protein PQX77_013849 [Marasmius sp. AFHP31]
MQHSSTLSSASQGTRTPRTFSRTQSAPVCSTEASVSDPQDALIADVYNEKLVQDAALQHTFESSRIPFAIQFEIACLVQSGPYRYRDFDGPLVQVAETIRTSRRPNSDGIKTLYSSLARSAPDDLKSMREASISAPWAALDLEEKALAHDPNTGCIGHMKLQDLSLDDLLDSQEDRDQKFYYGGKLDFVAYITESPVSYDISLRKVALAQSNKLKRRFGSASVLKCKIPGDLKGEGTGIEEFFSGRPVVVWTWVYRALTAKDDSVVFCRTNEKSGSDGKVVPSNNNRLSFRELIKWANPLEWNLDQSVAKWKSRMDLVLSTSVPGPLLGRDHISIVDDIVSREGSDMTDGCGYANVSFFKAVQDRYSLSDVPCAVQVRIFGAKGMLSLDSEARDDGEPRVWLRKSQKKVHFSDKEDVDPSHRTVDILRLSRVKTPARLSSEVIINLSHNGVPTAVFREVLETNLSATLEPLMTWGKSEPADMMRLLQVVDKLGNVSSTRRSRQCTTELRLRGYERDPRSQNDASELLQEGQSTAWWPDPFSGHPSLLQETISDLLVASFTPPESPYLRRELNQFVLNQIGQRCSDNHWEIPESATAFAVPDPYGVLGEDEIFLKSSRREFLDNDGIKTDIINGDVLITRNPCKLPTDVRKVKAVVHPRLLGLVDCIVFSIKGKRRPIDYLAGGDYDGDRVMVMWHEEMVRSFTNAPEHFATEPQEIGASLDVTASKNTVARFMKELGSSPSESARILSMQRYLLSGLRDPFTVGCYSVRHEKATYLYGLDDPRTVREAYMFCTILDSSKSGKKLLDPVRRRDIDQDPLKGKFLPWKLKLKKMSPTKERAFTWKSTEHDPLYRQNGHGQQEGLFIMEELCHLAEKQFREWETRAKGIFGEGWTPSQVASSFKKGADEDLKAPWVNFDNAVRARIEEQRPDADALTKDRAIIKKHVEDLLAKFGGQVKGGRTFSSKPILARQDTIRSLSNDFSSFPLPGDLNTYMDAATIARLRASYAYYRCRDDLAKPFPWKMAFRELCLMKAEASKSGFRPAVLDFADNYRLPKFDATQ